MNLKTKIKVKESEILKYKKSTISQKANLTEISNQVTEIENILKNQADPNHIFQILSTKFESNSYNDSYIIKCLQKDLLDYKAFVNDIISHKKPVIDQILASIQEAVDEINPDYKVNLYGSYTTGLCLPWSDIDVVLINQKDTHYVDEYLLSRLYGKLISKPWIKQHKFIKSTNIPIIKIVSNELYQQFPIDISVQCDKHFGLKCVELVKSFLREYEELEPIVLALKTLLNNGNLNNPYTGGLSSYGLILMVVSFIQEQINKDGKISRDSPTLVGEMFIQILEHYGIKFDYQRFYIKACAPKDFDNDTGMNMQEGQFFFDQGMHDLIIIDPLNHQNNVAKSTFQFMNIKMAFMIAFMVAKEDCECGCHYDILQNKMLGMEHCILKRIFNSVKRFSEANKNIY